MVSTVGSRLLEHDLVHLFLDMVPLLLDHSARAFTDSLTNLDAAAVLAPDGWGPLFAVSDLVLYPTLHLLAVSYLSSPGNIMLMCSSG